MSKILDLCKVIAIVVKSASTTTTVCDRAISVRSREHRKGSEQFEFNFGTIEKDDQGTGTTAHQDDDGSIAEPDTDDSKEDESIGEIW